MATNEPMTDERLSEIRARVKNAWAIQALGPANMGDLEPWQLQSIAVAYVDDVADLLDEVERRRAREAAALAIVREVATEDTLAYEGDAGDDYRCVFCGGHFDWRDGYEHTVPMREQMDDIPRALIHAPDCPVTKARALLADEEH